jgi:hypothetical protein
MHRATIQMMDRLGSAVPSIYVDGHGDGWLRQEGLRTVAFVHRTPICRVAAEQPMSTRSARSWMYLQQMTRHNVSNRCGIRVECDGASHGMLP